VALAAEGWHVTAVDHLPDALELGKGLARRYAPNGKDNIQGRCEDALNFKPTFEDLDLVYLLFFYDIRLLPTVYQALKPGGRLVIESFSTLHREQFGKPTANRCIDISQWESHAEGFHIESMIEQWIGERHIAHIVAQKD
jgi:SAM-dependent methyltransferase